MANKKPSPVFYMTESETDTDMEAYQMNRLQIADSKIDQSHQKTGEKYLQIVKKAPSFARIN